MMLIWYEQEHPASCVAACVRMVLTDFGQTLPEAQVRQILGQPRLGLTLTAACTRLVQEGAIASLHADWSLDDLRDALNQNLYPIVGVERHLLGHPPASHAIVLIGITSSHVAALDPLDGPHPQHYGTQAFGSAWKQAGREALVIESPLLIPFLSDFVNQNDTRSPN